MELRVAGKAEMPRAFPPWDLDPFAARSRALEASQRVNNNHTSPAHTANKYAEMSRQSMAPNRNLSLTEELEKLEQSITLTLQGKQSLRCPANTTDNCRNRPQLQSRASHRHNGYPANRRAVWKAL